MTTINLKDFYYWYTQDQLIEVSDEVAEVFKADARYEMAYQRRLSRHKAQYSLGRGDGIEHSSLHLAPSPAELYEEKQEIEALYAAFAVLPEKHGHRVYAHYILGVSKAKIARAEEVAESAVRDSISRGLKLLRELLKKSI